MDVNREMAWKLLTEFTQNDSLIKHALAVEAAMRAYAEKFGEDVERWGVIGLIHDFDYEKYPDPADHPRVGGKILEERGYPPDIIYAVLSHASHMNLPRERPVEKALFAVDELCGFVTAATLVRPGKKVAELPVASVKKKLKDKAFARSVNRNEIYEGAAALGVDLDEHIAFVIAAMARVADRLGL
ncbi:MAG TPA: HDIG domain-containing protein [Acidobacteriota bacterium]|nr:HDIG domain-containing protein [Acidobacteriota bacterium]